MLNLDMEIKIEVKERKFNGSVREIVQIIEGSLTEEFANQPSLYAWFATLAEIASAEYEMQKFDLSVLKANLDKKKREDLKANLEKAKEKGSKEKVTEAMVESAIQSDGKFCQISRELIETGRQYGILKALVKALEQRKDMLIQMGSTRRQEMMMTDMGVNLSNVRKNNN